jgi:putative endonuclease
MANRYFVYVISSQSRTLYVGTTNDLQRRVVEHKRHAIGGYADGYNVTQLVHFEETSDVHVALVREKEIKRWRREKKTELVEARNPGWDDLAGYVDDWGAAGT